AAQCGVEPAASHARFRQGLIAIWTKKNDQATTAMRAVVSAPAGSPYHGRAKFWLHHLARLAKNEGQAVEMRESLWRDHTMSFHNLVVNGREPRLQALISNATAPKVVMRSLLRPDVNAHVRSIEALLETGARELAAEFADRLAAKSGNAEPEVRLYLAALMHRAGSALPKFRILTSLFQDAPRLVSRPTLELLFPKWYFDIVRTKAKDIDPLLVLSLIRQESAFNERAHSTAGARGLMQVMPATARSIAAVRKNRLWDPNTNVEVGTKYLAHRLERYNGDVELTLAAYNAGFSRVDRWMKRYPLENKLLFVDLIPFRETREYVSSILRNYFWYTQLYGDEGAEMAAAGGTTASEPGEGSGAAFSKTSRNQEKVSRILEANAGARAPANDLIAR
ncbi:MAG: lytic transglycosylase domain-containing protein, partial [Bdellovibrionaceae bacterium]|nr:lytic transglycosylase domain-containing protein [Pseudobdellovibrionaceae bacterium]